VARRIRVSDDDAPSGRRAAALVRRPSVRTGTGAPPDETAIRPGDLTAPGILCLQRAAGNRAATVAVQRQPPGTVDAPGTLSWETDDSSAENATLHRVTKVEATRRGEVGPIPPRINYERRVDLRTGDGITAHLRITTTVYLRETDPLPASEAEALRAVGRSAGGGWYFNAEGSDLVPTRDHGFYEPGPPLSLLTLSAGFPDYALLRLTSRDQERALLRHLAGLPRRRPPKPAESGGFLARAADLISDFVPGLSNLKDFLTFATGVNPVSKEKVGPLGRLLALVLAIPVLGSLLKLVGKGSLLFAKHVLGPLVKIAMSGGGALVKWAAKNKWLGPVLTWGGKIFRGVGKRLRSLIGAKKLKGAKAANARASFTLTDKQVQKKFQKHAADFGVQGNWNPANAKQFRTSLENHVKDTANEVVVGRYHGAPALIHVNPVTGLAVVTDKGGAFISGWKLGAEQLRNVMAHGHLGGG
jgi:hypothetical protein